MVATTVQKGKDLKAEKIIRNTLRRQIPLGANTSKQKKKANIMDCTGLIRTSLAALTVLILLGQIKVQSYDGCFHLGWRCGNICINETATCHCGWISGWISPAKQIASGAMEKYQQYVALALARPVQMAEIDLFTMTQNVRLRG